MSALACDHRGDTISPNRYGQSSCYDIGAVQTGYGFTLGPNPVVPMVTLGSPINPAPVAAVTESGNPLIAGAATVNITDAQSDLSGSATVSVNTSASHIYGDAPFTVSATSPSTEAITYSVVTGPATISGSTVTLTGEGTVILQASLAASTNYVAGSAQATFACRNASRAGPGEHNPPVPASSVLRRQDRLK